MQANTVSIVNRICYVCALVSVFVAVALAIMGIWMENPKAAVWRSLATCGVLTVGNVAVVMINRALLPRSQEF